MPFDPFPKLFESVNSIAITHIDYPARVKINDNCFVYMTFSDSKLINTNVLDSFQGGLTIVLELLGGMYFLDWVRIDVQMICNIMQCHSTEEIYYLFGKSMGI